MVVCANVRTAEQIIKKSVIEEFKENVMTHSKI
jgi:hypothetical protein